MGKILTIDEARALMLLEQNGILKLKEGAGITATKNDIVDSIYKSTDVEKQIIQEVLDNFLLQLKSSLENGATIELRGFGTFEPRLRKGRSVARNPKTGETIMIEPKKKIKKLNISMISITKNCTINSIFIINYIFSVSLSIFNMRFFVYQSKNSFFKEYRKGWMTYLSTLLLNYVFLFFAIDVFHIGEIKAQAVYTVLITIYIYFMHKYFTFSKRENKK